MDTWWSDGAVAVVTGSNRGIGYAIAHQLGAHGFTVVLTDKVGSEELNATAENLEKKLWSSSSAAKEGSDSSHEAATKPLKPRVFSHTVDVRSSESVQQLANWVKEKFGQISILVNNAGIGFRRLPCEVDGTGVEHLKYEVAEDTLQTNFWGTKRVTEALLPLMTSPEGGRIIFITSRLGTYMRLGAGFGKETLGALEQLSTDDLDRVGRKYLDDVRADRLEQGGWIRNSDFFPAYSESKMLVSAYMILLAKSLLSNGKPGPILVSAMCPGATITAMVDEAWTNELIAMGWEMKSPAGGADTAVWLALHPKDGYPNGKLYAERQEFSYDVDDLF